MNGSSYHFLDHAEFERRLAGGAFVESAEYGGHRYGTLRSEVEKGLAAGKNVVLDIEVAGARQVREKFPNSVHVFVLPPSALVLAQRLRLRKTEDAATVARRLAIASDELLAAREYEYVVVNDDVVDAVAHVAAILDGEGRRVRRLSNLDLVIENLRRDLAGQH